MKLEKLIAMANQIGSFFEAMTDREQAVADVASHLKRSWEPRMRQQILASLGTADEKQLKPLVREALLLLLRDAQA